MGVDPRSAQVGLASGRSLLPPWPPGSPVQKNNVTWQWGDELSEISQIVTNINQTLEETDNMSISVAQLKTYIKTDLNVLIVGPAGTGKTAMLQEACEGLGLRMKYYHAATLDPFADLIGIPVPDQETKTVEYYRPHDVDNAEVIFCDELNRASTQTTNAIFEMIQFRSINGEPLPKLRCVVAAMNPVEDAYDTDELDIALLDRFDVYLNAPAQVHAEYFIKKYGRDYARVGIEIFNEYQADYNAPQRSKDNKPIGYFSPRRLDKLMDIFQKFPTPQTVSVVLPHNVILNNKMIANKFNIALGNQPAPSPEKSKEETHTEFLDQYYQSDISYRRNIKQAPKLVEAYKWVVAKRDQSMAASIRDHLAVDLNQQVGVDKIVGNFKLIIQDFDDKQLEILMNKWNYTKMRKFSQSSMNWSGW